MNANRVISIALGLLTVGLLALGWLVGIAPKLAEAARADGERALVEAQNAALGATLAQLADKYENIDDLRDEIAELQRFIPEGHLVEAWVDRIDAHATSLGLVVDVITVGEPIEVVPSDVVATDSPATGPVLIGIEVSVQVIGGVTELVALADAAQHAERVFVVTGLTFENENATGLISGTLYVIAEPTLLEPAA